MTGGGARALGWDVWSLAFWWSTWSLADTYLLKYSPWPELCVLGACGLVGLAVYARAVRTTWAAAKRGVQLATTHTGT